MFATATLAAHRGAALPSREELARYEPPPATATWKPVKYSLIVDFIHEELERRDMRVAKEEYAIQRGGNHLFAALSLKWLEAEECTAAIAFRHSNDKTEAMKMYDGVHVFVCDNMALSGDEIVMNRKHTTRLNVAAEPNVRVLGEDFCTPFHIRIVYVQHLPGRQAACQPDTRNMDKGEEACPRLRHDPVPKAPEGMPSCVSSRDPCGRGGEGDEFIGRQPNPGDEPSGVAPITAVAVESLRNVRRESVMAFPPAGC